MKSVHDLDNQHKDSSVLRPMAPRVQKVLGAMNMYMDLIGILVGYSGEISGLIVGALKCVLSVSCGQMEVSGNEVLIRFLITACDTVL